MKKKILLVWWYDRLDLIEPFLSMQDEVEFTVLFYRFPEQENKAVADTLPFRRIFWLDYLSPYSLLMDVQPEKVLFFGNESVGTISLIAAANVMKIETCYVSHGLRSSLDEVIVVKDSVQTIDRYREDNKYYTAKKWHTLLFLFLVISFRNLKTIHLVLQVLYAEFKIKNTFKKLLFITNPLRKVKKYYLFAPENSLMMNELDHPHSSQIKYTGPYMMDQLFQEMNTKSDDFKNYWLVIDQPIAQLTSEERFDFYKSIGHQANSKGKKLKVKLHPMEYDRIQENDANIEWVKQSSDLSKLINEASGIIGFYSALFLPIITFKKCILFDTGSTQLVHKWSDMEVVKLLNIKDFDIADINFDNFDVSESNKQKYIHQFVAYTDGNCTKRLKKLITN